MTASSMRAAIVVEPGQIRIDRVAIPEPGPEEVRIRLEGCGVCASNLAPWQGQPWFTYPFAPGALGHEGWGVIDKVGSDVSEWQPGDRVAALSQNAYAEYDVADRNAVARLQENLNGQPFPGEPLGCALNIFHRSDIRTGQTVAIIGIGFLGALLTRLASQAGARVIAISRRPYALEVARTMGAIETFPLEDHWQIIEQVKQWTQGRFCDVVIEAVGKQWPLDLGGELTRERGRLIIAGYHQDGLRQVNMQLWNWRGLDVINAHEREQRIYMDGIREAAQRVGREELDPTSLYTHVFPLEQLGDALNATRDRPDGFMKALVQM